MAVEREPMGRTGWRNGPKQTLNPVAFTNVILNQVGGAVGGEERSGRGILIPNAILFQNVIINHTPDQEFMLDEVPVRLTFDSDRTRAKEIMIATAKEVTKDGSFGFSVGTPHIL